MIKNIIYISFLITITSCSLANNKHVLVPIKSNPSNAAVIIDNQYYGQTPLKAKLIPNKSYHAQIIKEGYKTAHINLESWYSVRGGRKGENVRCAMDAMGTMLILPAFGLYSVHCRDFKKREYIGQLTPEAFHINRSITAPEKQNNSNNNKQENDNSHKKEMYNYHNYYDQF